MCVDYEKEITKMAISFKGAKKYAKHNGFSRTREIKNPIPSLIHYYSTVQNGYTLEPTVAVGDFVLTGQKIADIAEFNTIPVVSGSSGRVVTIDNGIIAVENDMMFGKSPHVRAAKPLDELTTRETLWLLREGCVYDRLCRAPLHMLLSEKRVSDCIIVCCFDSDPYVSSPQMSARGNAPVIITALELCMKLSGITKAFVAVENDTKKTFADFKYYLRYNPHISPVLLQARYPQSRSDILINTVTGSPVTNALILSPETLVNMHEVMRTGMPVTKKIVTVSGDEILEPENFFVPIGATVASVLESGGYSSPAYVIDGGVIDGARMTDLDEPVTHDTKALVAFNEQKNIPKYRKLL